MGVGLELEDVVALVGHVALLAQVVIAGNVVHGHLEGNGFAFAGLQGLGLAERAQHLSGLLNVAILVVGAV